MGQLPFQISQPCTHNGFAPKSHPFGVMLAMCKAHASRTTFVWSVLSKRHFLNPLQMFNRLAPEQGIARQTLGRSLTLALNDSTRGTVSWIRFKLFDELYICFRGFLTFDTLLLQ